MKTFFAVLAAGSFLLTGCGSGEAPKTDAPAPAKEAAKETPKSTEPGGNPLTAPVDYLGSVAKSKHTADAVLDTAALNQQVQLFFAQEGRFPKDLDELVTSKYMKSLPTPPHGSKLEYNAANGTVKVVKQ